MLLFCNHCYQRLCNQSALVTTCSHVLCPKCLQLANADKAPPESRGPAAAAGHSICAKCQRQCSTQPFGGDTASKLQRMIANPRERLLQLGKAVRFQLRQLHYLRRHFAQQRRLRDRLQRIRRSLAIYSRRCGMLRQLKPRVTLLRTELRNKFTLFVQAIQRGESLEEVRKIHQSAQRTFERSHKLVESVLPKLENM